MKSFTLWAPGVRERGRPRAVSSVLCVVESPGIPGGVSRLLKGTASLLLSAAYLSTRVIASGPQNTQCAK